jgi:hypothetical protein
LAPVGGAADLAAGSLFVIDMNLSLGRGRRDWRGDKAGSSIFVLLLKKK